MAVSDATRLVPPVVAAWKRLFREELLNGEILYTLKGAYVLIEQWQRHYGWD